MKEFMHYKPPSSFKAVISFVGIGTVLLPVAGFHRAHPSTSLDKDLRFIKDILS
jgi:hypothetical protein